MNKRLKRIKTAFKTVSETSRLMKRPKLDRNISSSSKRSSGGKKSGTATFILDNSFVRVIDDNFEGKVTGEILNNDSSEQREILNSQFDLSSQVRRSSFELEFTPPEIPQVDPIFENKEKLSLIRMDNTFEEFVDVDDAVRMHSKSMKEDDAMENNFFKQNVSCVSEFEHILGKKRSSLELKLTFKDPQVFSISESREEKSILASNNFIEQFIDAEDFFGSSFVGSNQSRMVGTSCTEGEKSCLFDSESGSKIRRSSFEVNSTPPSSPQASPIKHEE